MPITKEQKDKLLKKLQILNTGGESALAISEMIDALETRLSGITGPKGAKGDAGYSPVKGRDYFTADEIYQFITAIQQQIRVPNDGITPVAGKDYPTDKQLLQKIIFEVSKVKIPTPKDGQTPVKGKDYFTDTEVRAIVERVKGEIKLPELTPEQIKNIILRLPLKPWIPAEMILNLPIMTRELPNLSLFGGQGGGGARLEILVSGIRLGQDIRKINFSGATGTRDADGVATIVTGSATGTQVIQEVPTGALNGINVTFTFAQTPLANTMQLYLDGMRLYQGATLASPNVDYTIAGAVVTFKSAPLGHSVLFGDYRY